METSTKMISRNDIINMVETGRPLHCKGNYFTFGIKIRQDAVYDFRHDISTIRQIQEIVDLHRLDLFYWHGFSHQGSLEIKLADGEHIFGRAWESTYTQTNLVNAAEKVMKLLGEMIDYDEMRKGLLRKD
jgi:hypothetical protein